MTWQEQAAIARKIRDDSLAKVDPPLVGLPSTAFPTNAQHLPKTVLTPREIELTETWTASKLLAQLQSRAVTAEEVTRAFLRRAAVAQAATNCLTELLWDDALERARWLDAQPKPVGPLHGLPISTKEHHGCKLQTGRPVVTNASWVVHVQQPHGPILLHEILWDAGCVFYARTTQPQSIMHLETESNVYGRTVNPYNSALTPGGSSGGEAALIGMRGSLVGIGGDIGGSIRCPAAHCGIYGFKPSTLRFPTSGVKGQMFGREAIQATNGPMATDRESLNLIMQTVLAAKPWRLEPSLRLAPWQPVTFDRPLKVAVQWSDGVVQPHPPMTRALREVAEACRKAGMKVVDWDCSQLDHKRGWDIISALYYPDGGKEVYELLAKTGEPPLPLTDFIIREQPTVRDRTQAELWKLCVDREAYRTMYARHWSKTADDADDGQEVDVILCPPNFGVATPHEKSRYWGYTSQWNLLDYPGAVFPVTTVDPAKDPKDESYKPKNAEDQFVYDLYDPALFKDMPVSLQVVGRKHCDEKVLAALEAIEKAMGRE